MVSARCVTANTFLFLLTGITTEQLQGVTGTVRGRGRCWEDVKEKKKLKGIIFTGDNYMIVTFYPS